MVFLRPDLCAKITKGDCVSWVEVGWDTEMKLHQENDGFSPIALVLETRHDVEIFWDIILRVRKCTDKDAEYEMAVKISDWLSKEAHL